MTDDNSRVVYEHDNPDARDIELVAATVSDWESYDTVFIGYPIWWGIAAWPMDNFVKANDFTGKTVVPFVLLPVPVWEKAENCWLSWQVQGTG